MAIKSSILPVLVSVSVLIPLILVIISGTSPSILPKLYFLETSVELLNIPAALSTSTFLKDLSVLTGQDLVGQDASASSLQLASKYTVHLLTSCTWDSTSTKTCTTPRIGFHFNPSTDLKLESTSMIAPDLASYPATSTFLGIAYILSLVLTIFAIITSIFNRSKFPLAGTLAVVFSGLSTFFLFCASIAAVITYKKLKSIFDSQFASFGIATSVGAGLFAVSFIAFLFSLTATIYLFIRARRPAPSSFNIRSQRYSDTKPGADVLVTGGPSPPNGTKSESALKKLAPASLLSRVPFFGSRGKYQQIEKQKGTALFDRERAVDHDTDWDPLVRREHDDNENYDGTEGDAQRGIAMKVLPGGKFKEKLKDTKDINTAYEPFRREDEGASGPRLTESSPAYDPVDGRTGTGHAF